MILHALVRAVAIREAMRRAKEPRQPQQEWRPTGYPRRRNNSPLVPAPMPAEPPEAVTEYEEELRKLPEPLRSHIRRGGLVSEGDSWPLILPEWVDAACGRWSARTAAPMTSLGVTVAQDRVTLARRHGEWFDDLREHEGIDAADGPAVAALVFAAVRGRCEIGFDLRDGFARPAYDHLKAQGLPVVGIGTEAAQHVRSGFPDMHSVMWWAFREALDVANGSKLALPRDAALKEELTALRWTLTEAGIGIDRSGQSPRAEAVVNAWACSGENLAPRERRQTSANVGYAGTKRHRRADAVRGELG